MSNIVFINSVDFGSTGRIALSLVRAAKQRGHSAILFVPRGRHNKRGGGDERTLFGSRFSEDMHLALSRLSGYNGCFSYFATRRLISSLRKLSPDIIHLHNLHNSYINLPLLFKYIKKDRIRVVWTLHDCWAFTGQCPHFPVGCEKWRSGCFDCPRYREYPKSLADRTRTMWHLKKKWFCGVEDMTLVTPSKWLFELVGRSFLGKYDIKLINNGIDTGIFYPRVGGFRNRYGLEGKYIVLGVALAWNEKKGLDVFIKLSEMLDDSYCIVLVGADEHIDALLPKNIVSVHKTRDREELADIYSSADVFVNPTREDTYPTVNIEALACGTPVLTFSAGGSAEIADESCGSAVDVGDVDAMYREIVHICKDSPFTSESCVKRANRFDNENMTDAYMKLYKEEK